MLLKLSGEALVGDGASFIDYSVLYRIAVEVANVRKLGVQVGIVIGGGNLFRGSVLSASGINRVTADHMGMLATLMNCLALRDVFEQIKLPVRLLSAIPMSGVADHFNLRKAINHLEEGRVVLLGAGTGNPLVTTDSAASLRGIEINANAVLKATNVDGVYSSDPRKDSSAVLYKHLTYQEALEKELAIMDLAAFCQCRDHKMQIRVFNIKRHGTLLKVVSGIDEGTLIS